jgi:hypothetical protein
LRSWKGLTETRFFDSENRRVQAGTVDARAVELIPLALYGLDYPKIPALLIDFRKPLNAKQRELSARMRDVVIDNLIPASMFSRIGEAAAHFFTRRRGTDIFQPSRWRSYSQLKTMLALDSHLSQPVRAEIARNLEFVADNPLENDTRTELQLARNQYQALLVYAQRSDGLRVRLYRDRRAELSAAMHTGAKKVVLKVAQAASIGLYRHREAGRPDLESLLESQRRDADYKRFLQAVSNSGVNIEIEWDVEKVRNALLYIARSKSLPPDEVVDVALDIFLKSRDTTLKRFSLDAMFQADESLAQKALARVLKNKNVDEIERTVAAEYLDFPNRAMPVENATGGSTN